MGLPDSISFLTALFAVFVSIGGYLALRQGYSKQLGTIQVSVIEIDGDTIYLIDEQRGPEKRVTIQIPIKEEEEEDV